jgi:cytoskeletal protein CcmA (bactofilin family)
MPTSGATSRPHPLQRNRPGRVRPFLSIGTEEENMFGKEPESQTVQTGQTSIIAQGCKFEGTIDIKGTLRIEGEFKGNIGVPESLVIGKTGVVHANCNVKNAIIGGQLYGNIVAENKIELQSGSHVEGDIKTKRLVIDEGVFFEGTCSMGSNKARGDQPATNQQTAAPAAAPHQGLGAKPIETVKK